MWQFYALMMHKETYIWILRQLYKEIYFSHNLSISKSLTSLLFEVIQKI